MNFSATGTRGGLWQALAQQLSTYDLSEVEVRIASKADERRYPEAGWLFYVRHKGAVVAHVCTHEGGFIVDQDHVAPDAQGVAAHVAPRLERVLLRQLAEAVAERAR